MVSLYDRLLWSLNMSTDGDAVKTREVTEETTDVTLIDSSLNVTGNLTAKRMHFGSNICNIGIETVTEGGVSYPEMYVTLPNTYRGARILQKYRMRSIIEAIQELNRRTAIFDCNANFDIAKTEFDTTVDKNDDRYNQFACNEHDDGLPAATNGSLDDLTDEFKIHIIQDGKEPIITTSVYPLKDILQWETFVASESFAAFLETMEIAVVGLTQPTMDDVDQVRRVVSVKYVPIAW